MVANLPDTQIYFDIEGSALVPHGDQMREKPIAFLIHGGPGADHTSYKPTFSALSDKMQLVYLSISTIADKGDRQEAINLPTPLIKTLRTWKRCGGI